MSIDNPHVLQWKTERILRAPSTGDTLVSDLSPSQFAVLLAANQIRGLKPYLGTALRFFGKGGGTDTAIIRVTGWMSGERPAGPGRGLLKGTVTLSGQSFTGIPLADGKWGASTAWREGVFATTGGYNGCEAQIQTTGDGTSEVLLPANNYNMLGFEIASIGGGSQATDFGIIGREIQMVSARW